MRSRELRSPTTLNVRVVTVTDGSEEKTVVRVR